MLDIYPAIDLKDGQAVRLFKGEMASATIYGEPLAFAQRFEQMGAKWLHIVDLNGAFKGTPQNTQSIKNILSKTKLKIQLGGGIRNEETIKQYRDLGISRVILGSVALANPDFALEMAQKYPIAIGIDSKGGRVAVEGWAKEGALSASEFAKKFKESKIEAIISTDIERDGALSGINVSYTQQIAQSSGIYTIASGGFASDEEIENLSENPHIAGLIIGKAFYEGKINLAKILQKCALI